MNKIAIFSSGLAVGVGSFALWSSFHSVSTSAPVALAPALPPIETKTIIPASEVATITAKLPKVKATYENEGDALKDFLSERQPSLRARKLSEYIERLNPQQRLAFLGFVRNSDAPGAEKRALERSLFQRWVEVDPMGAVGAFRILSSTERNATIDAFATAWAATDSRGALAWASALPASEMRGIALGKILSKVVVQDPDNAVAELNKLDAQTARTAAPQIYGAWIDADPAAAISAMISGFERGMLGGSVAKTAAVQFAERDPKAAIEWLLNTPPQKSSGAMQFGLSLVTAAADIDPSGTAKDLMAQSNSEPKADLFRATAFSAWLRSSPDEAAQWLKEQPLSASLALVQAASRIHDPALAQSWLPLIESLPPGAERQSAFQGVVTQWAATNPSDALEYLVGVQDNSLKTGVLPKITQALANTDPQLAFSTATSLPDDPSKQKLLINIANSWADKDPAGAAAQVAAMPDTDTKNSLILSTAATWSQKDPKSASAWTQSLPSGLGRDNALLAISRVLKTSDPMLAKQNAEAIQIPVIRQNALSTIR